MAEELGKIKRPTVDSFKKGRKLFFIPLIYGGEDSPKEYNERFNKYWSQVEKQIIDLTLKLGEVNRIYHELISLADKEGGDAIKELNEKSHGIVEQCLAKNAQLEAVEDMVNAKKTTTS